MRRNDFLIIFFVLAVAVCMTSCNRKNVYISYRHVPVSAAGGRADAAVFQLRRLVHRDAVCRHGHRFGHQEAIAAGMAEQLNWKSPAVPGSFSAYGGNGKFACRIPCNCWAHVVKCTVLK